MHCSGCPLDSASLCPFAFAFVLSDEDGVSDAHLHAACIELELFWSEDGSCIGFKDVPIFMMASRLDAGGMMVTYLSSA